MRNFMNRMADLIAPKVCDACDGGSGAFYDRDAHAVIICPVCVGSGKASATRYTPVVDLAAARAIRTERENIRDAA